MNPFYPGNNTQNPIITNFSKYIQQFQNFRSAFQGDPKQKVQELLASGEMSQSQYDQYSQIAAMLTGFRK